LPPVARKDYRRFHVYCAQQWQAGKYPDLGVSVKLPHTTGIEILDTWSPRCVRTCRTFTYMFVGAPKSYLSPRASATAKLKRYLRFYSVDICGSVVASQHFKL